MCFNHYFVTDVKPAICWVDNCLYDLSTINQLIDEEDLINKDVKRILKGKVHL